MYLTTEQKPLPQTFNIQCQNLLSSQSFILDKANDTEKITTNLNKNIFELSSLFCLVKMYNKIITN